MKEHFCAWLWRLLALGLLPLFASACDCSYPGAPCKAFANTPTVFTGRVVKISVIPVKASSGDAYRQRLVAFDVERSYRGWEGKTAEVVTGMGGGDCGYDFREDAHYLVYAYPHPATGKLYTGICQRTRSLAEASEDLKYLARKDDPSHGAGIEGVIEVLDAKTRAQAVGFLVELPVVVEGPSVRQTILSRKDGRFQLWGLSPGRYRVTPVFPKSFWPVAETVELKRNSCAEVRFLATPRPHHRSSGLRREEKWHQLFQGQLARIEMDRTLYERAKDQDCLIAVRITNVANRPVGVDLRKFWNVIYPNSWGFSKTRAPEIVDEERIIREPISATDRQRLTQDYSENLLTIILPHRSITYFRGFTIGDNIRKRIESAAAPYFIIGLDGALRITDGQTTEELTFPANDEGPGRARWVAIQLPAIWRSVRQNSLIVEQNP